MITPMINPQPRRQDQPENWVRRRTLITLFGAAAATTLLPPAAAVAAPTSASLGTQPGVLLGAYLGRGAWYGARDAKGAVTAFERQIGRRLAIDHRYYSWRDPFPNAMERWDLSMGRIPMISWEPYGVELAAIAAGREDALLRLRGRQLAALGRPVFLRFAHEMNIRIYSWGCQPAAFRSAWRRVRRVLRGAGATNVVMVWCPNAEDVPQQSWNHWTNYYPGDSEVDWVGVDVYNFGTTKPWSRWRSMSEVLRPVYDDYQHRKPIMIAELACAGAGGDRATWLRAAARDLGSSFPRVKAAVHFADPSWPLTSPASVRDALRDISNRAPFAPAPS